MALFSTLEPKSVWSYFEEILRIPRASKKEEQIIAYLEDFAIKQSLEYKKDDAGNILMKKPASKGFENKKAVILQSHVDMVCEKLEDSNHNFDTDPIPAYTDKDWVRSKGTTLGADNGIGVATQMAILTDKTLQHGPIECLFTVDEETGLTGAYRLSGDFLSGSLLLNLDSEDEGELFIGCAGGMDTLINMPYKSKSLEPFYQAYIVNIKGLIGGHSGDDIHKGRGNSNKILARFLINANKKFSLRLVRFQGGNLRNAIPREAKATVAVHQKDEALFGEFCDKFKDEITEEYQAVEPNLTMVCQKTELPAEGMRKKYQKRFLNAMHACPNGVIEMSREIKNLVETSSNLASVRFVDEKIIEIVTSQRSSVESAKYDIASRITSLFELAKAKVQNTDTYPGWTPNLDSDILRITENAYTDLFGEKPIVRAIHAGLECGLFLKKYPRLDMISFGPTIRGAHSPDERMEIKTVEKFWRLLLRVLENIPEV